MDKSHDWTLELSFGELALSYRWRELYSLAGQPMGYYGYIAAAGAPEDIEERYRFSHDEKWIEDAAKRAASSFRQVELRREISLNGFEWVSSDEPKRAKILELFHLSEDGYYLGQRSGNQNVYVQDLAELLDLNFGHARDLVDELVAEGKLGLSGMILISAESYEDAFSYWQEETGHRKLFVGDWGPWACHACGKSGDEYENPRDFECRAESSEAG